MHSLIPFRRPALSFLACIAAGSLRAQGPSPVAPPTFGARELGLVDSIAEAEFRRDSLGSITVGIVSGRDLVWAKSYGYMDRARRHVATPATLYRIASVTKQVTAIMLLQLSDRRVVSVSDPVAMYFPEIQRVNGAREGRSPTLLQLATMTSGLARNPNDQRKSQARPVDRWDETLIAALPATHFASEPGTAYRYSNVGFAILGAALARAASSGYIEYVRLNILRPLGMTSTDFTLSSDMRQRLAAGVDYDVLYKDTLNYDDAAQNHVRGLGWGVPAGELYSTVSDVAKLVALQIGFGPAGDSVLSAAALARRDSVPVASQKELWFGYGLGVQVARWADTTALGHSGNTAGYTSQVYYDPVRKYGVVVLRSAAGGRADAHRLAGSAYRKLRSALPK